MLFLLWIAGSAFAAEPFITATLEPRSGSQVTGSVSFMEKEKNQLEVVLVVAGASPGKHGFHIHEHGDCSAADGSSAGGHHNPLQHAHGGPHSRERHVGDFGNIEIAADGTGKQMLTLSGLSLGKGPTSILGRALILHEKEDDFGQPTGNAGGRIACAVLPVRVH